MRRGFPIWNIVGRKTRKVGTIARNVRSGRSLRLTVYGSKNFRPTLSAVTNVTLEWRKRIAPIPPDYRLNSTGEALTEVSVDIDSFQGRDFHERGGPCPVEYRAHAGSDIWHFCQRCSQYPKQFNLLVSYDRPNGPLCDECQTLERQKGGADKKNVDSEP